MALPERTLPGLVLELVDSPYWFLGCADSEAWRAVVGQAAPDPRLYRAENVEHVTSEWREDRSLWHCNDPDQAGPVVERTFIVAELEIDAPLAVEVDASSGGVVWRFDNRWIDTGLTPRELLRLGQHYGVLAGRPRS